MTLFRMFLINFTASWTLSDNNNNKKTNSLSTISVLQGMPSTHNCHKTSVSKFKYVYLYKISEKHKPPQTILY